MRIFKSLPLSVLSFLVSTSSALAQVATAPASPQAILTPTPGGAGGTSGTGGASLPEAGLAAPTLILLSLGVFFLIIGLYKFYQLFSKR